MKIFKQIAAVVAVAGATVAVSKALMTGFEATGKVVANRRLKRKLTKEEATDVLLNCTHDINHVYDSVKPFFKDCEISYEEEISLKSLAPWQFDFKNKELTTMTFETSYPDSGVKTAYYNIMVVRSGDENVMNMILRLHIEGWEGYIDFSVCDVVAKNIENSLYLEVINVSPYLMDAPVVGDFIVLERFGCKDTHSIIVQNRDSKSKVVGSSFHSDWK